MAGGSSCSHMGHAYYLGMAYAFCGESDEVLGFRRAGTTEWEGSISTSGGTFTAKTGIRPDPVPRDYRRDLESCDIRYYAGTQTTADPALAAATGYQVSYTGTTYITFNNGGYGAYIGTNVTTAPQYKMKLRRVSIHAALGDSLVNTNDVNPAHVLYDILVTHLELPASRVDTSAFIVMADTLRTEGIGLSFLMSHEKKAKDWVDEILRHVDAIMSYDVVSGKYTVKLVRDDYDINTIDKITENNSFGVIFERNSWVDTFNTITFKYTEIDATEMTSMVLVDTASKKTVGQVKAKVVEYPMITDTTAMELIANRAIKKLAYPLAVVKCKISTIDFPDIKVGDVVNLSHSTYGVTDLAIRVMSLGGDAEDSTVIDLEGTEDIYGIAKATSISMQSSLATGISWTVNDLVYAVAIDAPPELYTFGTIIPIAADPGVTVTYISCVETDNTSNHTQAPVYELGVLMADTNDEEYGISEISFYGTSSLQETVTATDIEWQSGKNTLVVDDEVMIYRDLIDIGGGNWKVTGVIRGAFGSLVTTHAADSKIWITTGTPTAITPSSVDYNVTIAGANPKAVGVGIEVTGTYGYTGVTPYPPANIEASRESDDITVSWSPATRQKGATYYVATNILAGMDEEAYEGVWLVTWDTGSQTVTSPTFTQTEAATKTYTVVSVINGRYSSNKTIDI